MKHKRIFALLLVCAIAFALIGCGSGGNANDGAPKDSASAAGGGGDGNGGSGSGSGGAGEQRGDAVNLIIYSQLANYSGEQIGWAAQILKEKFNVKVTIIPDADGTFATRMAEGNLGDIVIFGSDGRKYLEAIEGDMLFNWEDEDLLSEYGPYIKEHMTLALEKNREISVIRDKSGDIVKSGGIYGFGQDVAGSSGDHDAHIYYPYLRWDLYTQLGRPQINTLEDFIPVLEEMQKLEPVSSVGTKTYGVSSFPDWDGDMVMMVKSTGALYGWEEFGIGLYHVTDQVFQGSLEPGGMYLRCLKFYNTLFQKGLYDPDSISQTFDDAAAKYTNGVSFWNIFTFVAESYNKQENLDAGKAMQCVPAKDQQNVATGLNVYGKNRVWTIGAKTNYPELCMEIINWFCTPEGVLTYNYGPQGVTWDYDENGNTYLTEVGLQTRKDKKTELTYGNYTGLYQDGEFQHNNTTWTRDSVNPDSASGETFNWENWNSTVLNRPVSAVEQSWRDWAGAVRADEFLDNNGYTAVAIGTKFAMATPDNDLELVWTQVRECIKQGSWQAIYSESDAEFDYRVGKMIKDAKAYGYDECIEWAAAQAQLRKAAENDAKGAG